MIIFFTTCTGGVIVQVQRLYCSSMRKLHIWMCFEIKCALTSVWCGCNHCSNACLETHCLNYSTLKQDECIKYTVAVGVWNTLSEFETHLFRTVATTKKLHQTCSTSKRSCILFFGTQFTRDSKKSTANGRMNLNRVDRMEEEWLKFKTLKEGNNGLMMYLF